MSSEIRCKTASASDVRQGGAHQIKLLQVATTGITFKVLLSSLVERLQREGYAVHVTCADGPYTPDLIARGYAFTPIAIERKVNSLSNLKALWQLYRLMRRERYDIVHVHTPVASVIGRAAARLAGVPVVIYTAHGFYFHERMSRYVRTPIVWTERLLGRVTDALLTQSAEDAATAVRYGICPPEKVRWISNGVNIREFAGSDASAARQEFGLSEGDLVVGFVGRMVREKGVLELVQAMRRVADALPNARLLMVGDTLHDDRDRKLKDALRRLIEESGMASRTVFTGFVDGVSRAMSVMDVFVLPSYREGMPRTIIEAMACGKPVVATNIRGCREEVVHGVTGYLVPVKDPDALADAIIEVLSQPERAREMGEAGRRRAQELFDEETVLDRQVEVYRQLAQAKLVKYRQPHKGPRDEAEWQPGA